MFSWIVPAYARGEIGVGTRLIGLMVLANAVTVVVAQIPVARIAEGRRRAVTMATGALSFVGACLLVVGAGRLDVRFAAVALLAAVVVVGVGECLHTTVLMPLVADLAPAALRGRYMALALERDIPPAFRLTPRPKARPEAPYAAPATEVR